MNRQGLFCGVVGAVLTSSETVSAPSLTFDLQAFSSQVAPNVDISRFNTRNLMSPGIHHVDIVVNGQRQGRRTLEFVARDAANDAQPCVDLELLALLGVDPSQPSVTSPALQQPCTSLEHWLPLATSSIDAGALEWSVSIPQASLKRRARGYVDPAYWDDGIDAGLLNYTFSASTRTSGEGEDRRYLGLTSGINLGSWRLRHQGAQAWDSRTGLQRYQNTATYLQRSIAPWQAQLTLGDSFSGGKILEGVRLRGLSLATDERMRAQSMQGYAPQVHGIAESIATVTIRQNGFIVYETTVAPGPFVIGDLYATGYGGDLTVNVVQADGRRSSFIVPWSVAPQLLRVDTHSFNLNLGQIRQYGQADSSPRVFQASLAQGVSNYLTLYGGGSFTEGHHLTKLGVALGTPFGAFSLDGSQSHTRLPRQPNLTGRSVGIGYSHSLPASGTHLTLAMYRYSTRGYLGLNDALNLRERARDARGSQDFARQKSRMDLTISQQLGQGTLSLYGSSVDFWRRQDGRQTSFTLSYGSQWRSVSWNLSAQRTRVEDTRLAVTDREYSDEVFFGPLGQRGRLDNRLMLTLSMPLGGSLHAPAINTTLSRERGDRRGSQQQLGISGLLGEFGEASYGLSGTRSRAEGDTFNIANAYATVRTGAGQLRGGYAQARNCTQLSFSAEGGVIAHADGITWGARMGEASALVQAPDAQGARLGGAGGVRIDRRGFGVVPSLRAFHGNSIAIDPRGMAVDVELKESVQRVVPTAGAVTRLTFETLSGRAVVIRAQQTNGKPLPFAAQVLDEQGREVGVIGQASKAFVRGIAERGTLAVVWGKAAADRCFIAYRLPKPTSTQRQISADVLVAECVQGADVPGVTTR